jgi:transcriptional regulator with XRE-family HTH domain
VAAGQKLRAIREKKGMTQEDLAFEAKMDQSKLSMIERLGPHVLSFAKLNDVAEALDCVIVIDFQSKG